MTLIEKHCFIITIWKKVDGGNVDFRVWRSVSPESNERITKKEEESMSMNEAQGIDRSIGINTRRMEKRQNEINNSHASFRVFPNVVSCVSSPVENRHSCI